MARSALNLGKMIGNIIFIAVITYELVITLSILFDVSFFISPLLGLVMLMGVLGYSAVGTLIASMATYTRGREVLLPVLLLPIALSILIPSVRATRDLLAGRAFADVSSFINLLGIMTVIYITLSYLLFDFVVEE
ncbi:MAG: heme exporter protein CcmB [Anaerolineae bacterium]